MTIAADWDVNHKQSKNDSLIQTLFNLLSPRQNLGEKNKNICKAKMENAEYQSK